MKMQTTPNNVGLEDKNIGGRLQNKGAAQTKMSGGISEASFDEPKPSSRAAGKKPTSAGEDGGVRERRETMTKKKDVDNSLFITKEEFCNIWFDY